MKMQKNDDISPMEIKWNDNRVIFLNHHECHAAYSLFQSPFKNADIITVDGHGEIESCFIGHNKKTKSLKIFCKLSSFSRIILWNNHRIFGV